MYRLKKALYGLRQPHRAWNKRINSYLLQLGFLKARMEYEAYLKMSNNGELLIVCLYVDDLLVTGSAVVEIDRFKITMNPEYEITDLGILSHFLGMEFVHYPNGIILHQSRYITKVLKKIKMSECNLATILTEVNLKIGIDEVSKQGDSTLYEQIGCFFKICVQYQTGYMLCCWSCK